MKHAELLRLAGVLSDAARAVAGGKSITIGNVPAATAINISQRVDELREAVDAYDAEIIRITETST